MCCRLIWQYRKLIETGGNFENGRRVRRDDAGLQQIVARLGGHLLGTASLHPGWNELRWPLTHAAAKAVERLEIEWSEIRQASESDPRRLAARVRQIRFE